MKTSTLAWIVLLLLILVGGWYVWMQSAVPAPLTPQTTATSTSTTASTTSTSDGSAIQDNLTLGTDATTTLGTYLIAYNGMALYTFSKDATGTSTCYAACAKTWPPYVVPAGMQLNIESGVNSSAASTITRADGTTQVTYKGMPLYFYAGDTQSGDVSGQGVGKVWYVVKP